VLSDLRSILTPRKSDTVALQVMSNSDAMSAIALSIENSLGPVIICLNDHNDVTAPQYTRIYCALTKSQFGGNPLH
jgi:hypothetical protein